MKLFVDIDTTVAYKKPYDGFIQPKKEWQTEKIPSGDHGFRKYSQQGKVVHERHRWPAFRTKEP